MKYEIWYAISPSFVVTKPFSNSDLGSGSHKLVKYIEAESPDDAFVKMQGENWSPNGEARPLIKSLGLNHTSMSVGDVLIDETGRLFTCGFIGWLENIEPEEKS